MYCISLNNSRGQLLFFHTKGAGNYSREGAIIQGKRLFQIFLTGSHALNIQIFFSLNKLNMGSLSVPNLVP